MCAVVCLWIEIRVTLRLFDFNIQFGSSLFAISLFCHICAGNVVRFFKNLRRVTDLALARARDSRRIISNEACFTRANCAPSMAPSACCCRIQCTTTTRCLILSALARLVTAVVVYWQLFFRFCLFVSNLLYKRSIVTKHAMLQHCEREIMNVLNNVTIKSSVLFAMDGHSPLAKLMLQYRRRQEVCS